MNHDQSIKFNLRVGLQEGTEWGCWFNAIDSQNKEENSFGLHLWHTFPSGRKIRHYYPCLWKRLAFTQDYCVQVWLFLKYVQRGVEGEWWENNWYRPSTYQPISPRKFYILPLDPSTKITLRCQLKMLFLFSKQHFFCSLMSWLGVSNSWSIMSTTTQFAATLLLLQIWIRNMNNN